MSSPEGYLCLVLHGHLPFVRHPELRECLEEDWFFEALTEVYLPLLEMFDRLKKEGIDFPVAVGLSPTLTTMLTDPLLTSRYDEHLDNLIRLAESECRRTADSPEFAMLARMYLERFSRTRELWVDRFHRNLVGAFRSLRETSSLELITTAATHGFLPLMEVCPEAIRTQVELGCQSFERHFGNRPDGFWLPECGYTPAIDQALAQARIRYSFLETHGLLHAQPAPKFGVHAPVRSPEGVALFGRDPETTRQVWSSLEGYPGDEWYREFYRDIGFDLEEEYLRPFLYHGGFRVATGIKYFRITGKSEWKEPYQPQRALAKAQEHAGNFLFNRERQIEHLRNRMGQPPVVVGMYDAELFGHWWFEGPVWLEHLFRKFSACREVVQLTTPSKALSLVSKVQEVAPHLSTWGWKGYNEVWLQGANAWVYRHLHRAAWRMGELVATRPEAAGIVRRALNQALRELLLAQASDWTFILGQGTASDYARTRLIQHLIRFTSLYEQLQRDSIDEKWLGSVENQDNLFPFLDYRIYR